MNNNYKISGKHQRIQYMREMHVMMSVLSSVDIIEFPHPPPPVIKHILIVELEVGGGETQHLVINRHVQSRLQHYCRLAARYSSSLV